MENIEKKQSLLVQVDSSDNPIGLVGKEEAHLQGILHRAFSIFIFREVGASIQVLLQQRALHKYHSGGLWTNTCCSHAEPGISILATAEKRLQEEMGFCCPLSLVGSFYYKADVGNGMMEHEIDYVFAAFYNPNKIHLNHEEALACKWVDIECLSERIKGNPHEFTAWLPGALQLGFKFLNQVKT